MEQEAKERESREWWSSCGVESRSGRFYPGVDGQHERVVASTCQEGRYLAYVERGSAPDLYSVAVLIDLIPCTQVGICFLTRERLPLSKLRKLTYWLTVPVDVAARIQFGKMIFLIIPHHITIHIACVLPLSLSLSLPGCARLFLSLPPSCLRLAIRGPPISASLTTLRVCILLLIDVRMS